MAADFWIAPIVRIRGDLFMPVESRRIFYRVPHNAGQSRPIVMAHRAQELKQTGFARRSRPADE
jgi:hypothetical protein